MWKHYIPLYFYRIHESVNSRLGKPSFPYETLSTLYKDVSRINGTMTRLESLQGRAIKMGGVSFFYWKAWLKQYGMLKAAIL